VTQLPAQSKIVAQQPVETKIKSMIGPITSALRMAEVARRRSEACSHSFGVGSAWLWLAGFVSTMDHAPQALSLKCDSRWRLHSHPTAKI